MKNILICGCSFTQSRINEREEWINSNLSWIPYSDILYHDYKDKVKNIGQDSASNGWIYNTTLAELLKSDFNYDFVIIQWSAVMRAHFPDYNKLEAVGTNWPVGNPSVAPHLFEYIKRSNMPPGTVTDTLNQVESYFYLHTLINIYSLQKILESNNIRYFMFWGWNQITYNLYDEYKHIFDKIYNDNFWRFNNHGGMNEYIISKLGKEQALVPMDYHPSTKGHKLFYEDIIKPLIK